MLPTLSETRLIGPFIKSLLIKTCFLLSGVILIMELSEKVATYKFPLESVVTPVGLWMFSYTPEYWAIFDGGLTGFCGGRSCASFTDSASSCPLW